MKKYLSADTLSPSCFQGKSRKVLFLFIFSFIQVPFWFTLHGNNVSTFRSGNAR